MKRGYFLKKLIEKHGEEKLAKELQLSEKTFYFWKNGRLCNYTQAKKIAKLIGKTFEETCLLIGLLEEKKCAHCGELYIGSNRGKYCLAHQNSQYRRGKLPPKMHEKSCVVCNAIFRAKHPMTTKCKTCLLKERGNLPKSDMRRNPFRSKKQKEKNRKRGASFATQACITKIRECLDPNWKPDRETIEKKMKEFKKKGGKITKLKTQVEVPYFRQFQSLEAYEPIDIDCVIEGR